jgi:hypothetical protein
MTDNVDWMTVDAVNKAIQNYGTALVELKKFQSESGSYLPTGCINIGLLGEYYTYIWLKHKFPEATVSYGSATESAWDIQVTSGDNKTRYQVKTLCVSSKSLRITNLKAGFDQLVIVLLAEDYCPEDAYLLNNNFSYRELQSFTVPYGTKKGSKIFSVNAENIRTEFFGVLADRLT